MEYDTRLYQGKTKKISKNGKTNLHSCSFGKDSIATILLAMLHHEPLDRIVSVEVMFDNKRGISGENPEHIQWVKEVAIPRLKELTGIDTDLIHAERDYIYEVTHICTKEQTRRAYELGAPIENEYIVGGHSDLDSIRFNIPTTQQMINWLREKGIFIFVHRLDDRYEWIMESNNGLNIDNLDTYEQAELAIEGSVKDFENKLKGEEK